MNYVAHDCRNTRNNTCNNRWIDKDITKITTQIPTWKYCFECCKKLGINFENQKPSDYRSEQDKETRKQKLEKSKLVRQQKIKSEILQRG